MARHPSPEAAARYRLAGLLSRDDQAYERDISTLIGTRSTPENRIPGAEYLPSGKFVRDLGIGTASAGGNLLASGNGNGLALVAAAARPPLLLERLGAQRLEVSAVGDVSLPAWVAGAGGWIAEGATAASTASTVKTVTCSGKMAAARLAVSRRLMLQAADLEPAILAEVSAAVADVIEGGFIAGDGTANQPLGLLHTTGAGTKTFAAATPTYSELADMLETYALANGPLERACWLLHPSLATSLLKAEISANSGQMLAVVNGQNRQPLVLGIPAYVTPHCPNGKMILLDPAMCRTVFWDSPQVIVDRSSGGKSISGAAEIVILNLCDFAAIHPAHVVVGSA